MKPARFPLFIARQGEQSPPKSLPAKRRRIECVPLEKPVERAAWQPCLTGGRRDITRVPREQVFEILQLKSGHMLGPAGEEADEVGLVPARPPGRGHDLVGQIVDAGRR